MEFQSREITASNKRIIDKIALSNFGTISHDQWQLGIHARITNEYPFLQR